MDKIRIRGVCCQAHVGVTDGERSVLQDILVDLSLALDLEKAGREDHLAFTLDYAEVVREVQDTVEKTPYVLLEALVLNLCRALLDRGDIQEVQVTARKTPPPLKGKAEWVEVEMTRSRDQSRGR